MPEPKPKPGEQQQPPKPAAAADQQQPQEQTVGEAEQQSEEIEGTSSDAAYSTYTEVPVETDEVPAPGRQVEQTRGEATEGGGEAFDAKRGER